MNQKSAQKITEHLTIAWNTNSLKQNRIADAILMFTVTEKKIYLDGECKPIGISKYNFTVSNVLFVYLIYTLYNKAKLLHYVLFFYGCNIPNTVCGCWCLYHYLNGQSNRWVSCSAMWYGCCLSCFCRKYLRCSTWSKYCANNRVNNASEELQSNYDENLRIPHNNSS